MKHLAIPMCILLSGCQTTKEVVRQLDPFEVLIPVAQPCKVDLVVADYEQREYADNSTAMLSAPDVDAQTKLLLAGRAQRNADLWELIAVLNGCTKAPAP